MIFECRLSFLFPLFFQLFLGHTCYSILLHKRFGVGATFLFELDMIQWKVAHLRHQLHNFDLFLFELALRRLGIETRIVQYRKFDWFDNILDAHNCH